MVRRFLLWNTGHLKLKFLKNVPLYDLCVVEYILANKKRKFRSSYNLPGTNCFNDKTNITIKYTNIIIINANYN